VVGKRNKPLLLPSVDRPPSDGGCGFRPDANGLVSYL
jgi:hypothetical protein